MGLWANFPVAPDMRLGAFFAEYVRDVLGLHWTAALAAVFFSGLVFFVPTITRIHRLLKPCP